MYITMKMSEDLAYKGCLRRHSLWLSSAARNIKVTNDSEAGNVRTRWWQANFVVVWWTLLTMSPSNFASPTLQTWTRISIKPSLRSGENVFTLTQRISRCGEWVTAIQLLQTSKSLRIRLNLVSHGLSMRLVRRCDTLHTLVSGQELFFSFICIMLTLGSQIGTTCLGGYSDQSRLQCLYECPSSDMALGRVAIRRKSKILPPSALMDLTKKIDLKTEKCGWCFFLDKFEEP